MLKKRVFLRKFARHLGRHDSGQALIETALAVSFLSIIVLGTAAVGQVIFTAIDVTNAAKAGAQYAGQDGYTASDSTGISVAAQNDAPNLTGLLATATYACVCSDGSSSTCGPGDCSNSHILETVTVNTQYTFQPLFKLPWLGTSVTLTGSAVQECLQ